MKRYQDSNWIVKLWRRRHYVYIPFKFISYKLRGGDDFPNNKTLWGVLVGSAQCDMKSLFWFTIYVIYHIVRLLHSFTIQLLS